LESIKLIIVGVFQQLFFSLETTVLNNTSTVTQLGVIQDTGDEGGDFVFIKK